MKHALTEEARERLDVIAAGESLLAFDFDGTLAPINDDPERATMRPRTRELLSELAERYACIVLSGRAQDDILRKLRGVGVVEVIGNHGIEPAEASERYAQLASAWAAQLEPQLAGSGVHIEHKIFTLALHYRHAPDARTAKRRVLEAIADLEEVRVVGGKQVINLVPRGAPHKGQALRRALERQGCSAALFAGDDVTDEDVFRQTALDLMSIRVGKATRSAAQWFIRDQDEIDDLLQALVERRAVSARRWRR